MLIHNWTKENEKETDKKLHNIFVCAEYKLQAW